MHVLILKRSSTKACLKSIITEKRLDLLGFLYYFPTIKTPSTSMRSRKALKKMERRLEEILSVDRGDFSQDDQTFPSRSRGNYG